VSAEKVLSAEHMARTHLGLSIQIQDLFSVPGGHTGGAPPVPIPNTEVKPSKADDTAAVRQWESRTLPGYKKSLLVERPTGSAFLCPPAKPTFDEESRRVLSAGNKSR
jgi:hypothetical protein